MIHQEAELISHFACYRITSAFCCYLQQQTDLFSGIAVSHHAPEAKKFHTWIYPWIYPCVDMRFRPFCGNIHGYYAGAPGN